MLHGLVDLAHGGLQVSVERLRQGLGIHHKAAPHRFALAAHQQHSSAGLQRQAGSQRHGVGRFAKHGRPDSQPFGRYLVRQQAHGFATAQRLDHLAHPRQRGGHGLHAWAVACGLHHLGQPGLARGAVQHGDGALLGTPARGNGLGRHLKAPEVRGEKNHTAPGSPGLLHTGLALNAHRHGRAQPQPGQLGHHAPGVAYGGAHLRKRVARQRRIGQKALAIHARGSKSHPAQNTSDDVEQPQRKYGKESKDSRH